MIGDDGNDLGRAGRHNTWWVGKKDSVAHQAQSPRLSPSFSRSSPAAAILAPNPHFPARVASVPVMGSYTAPPAARVSRACRSTARTSHNRARTIILPRRHTMRRLLRSARCSAFRTSRCSRISARLRSSSVRVSSFCRRRSRSRRLSSIFCVPAWKSAPKSDHSRHTTQCAILEPTPGMHMCNTNVQSTARA